MSTATTHFSQTTPATYLWTSDAGHAWLSVEMEELDLLGIRDQISGYSYHHKGIAYLEEDCDAGLFISSMRARGVVLNFKAEHTTDESIIRTYKRFP